MSHGWASEDNAHACKQGWSVFNHRRPEIQRLDEEGILASDDEAKVLVLERAKTDNVCRKAIKICYGI